MSIPNPYPNIADKEINDVKTWSSAKIINELQPALDTEIHSENTYEGNIVTFNNLNNKNITSLDCKILPIQEGTGTPSPSNPRPISGTSVLDIYHSGADTSDYDTTLVTLGQEIMGGTADVVGGVGEKTQGYGKITDLATNYFYSTSNKRWEVSGIPNLKSFPSRSIEGLLSDIWQPNAVAYTGDEGKFFTVNGVIYFYTSNSDTLDGNIVYPLATPTPFTFTEVTVESLEGVNNIWCDTGDIKVTVVGTETIGNILKDRGILP